MAALENLSEETLDFSEASPKSAEHVMSVAVAFAEDNSKDIGNVNTTQAFRIQDFLKRRANVTMHDIIVHDVAKTLDELRDVALSGPVGYAKIKELVAGDYEYEFAKVGVQIRAPTFIDQFGIDSLVLNVDADDVNESGFLDLDSAEEFEVFFSKTFIAPPEVTVVFRGGSTVAIPEVTGISATSFTVQLRDVDNPSSLVTGTISWNALGY